MQATELRNIYKSNPNGEKVIDSADEWLMNGDEIWDRNKSLLSDFHSNRLISGRLTIKTFALGLHSSKLIYDTVSM